MKKTLLLMVYCCVLGTIFYFMRLKPFMLENGYCFKWPWM